MKKKSVSIKDRFYSSFENLFPNFIKHTFRPFSIFYFYLLFDRLKNIWNIHRRRKESGAKKKKCIDQGIDSNNPLSKIYFNFSSLCIKYFCFVSKISNIWNIHRVRRRRSILIPFWKFISPTHFSSLFGIFLSSIRSFKKIFGIFIEESGEKERERETKSISKVNRRGAAHTIFFLTSSNNHRREQLILGKTFSPPPNEPNYPGRLLRLNCINLQLTKTGL